jgi:exopolyphosphatase/guanosine-5'-triphosphate,3'-diphosphate pyrophosphatase
MSDTAPVEPPETLAAVDLGSNSFHMIVARSVEGHLQVVDRLKEMVRLGEGLNDDKSLVPEVEARAIACLERFGQRLRGLPRGSVRAVGTNTLRQIRPDSNFVARAESALGHAVEVIAGREEARIIYLGVARGLAADDQQRLVVDIGGGSTELIVGKGFTPLLRESLHMGCVSMSRRHFPDGLITPKAMHKAELYGALEIRPIRELFRRKGWRTVVGSSGTVKSIRDVVAAEGWSDDGITDAALDRLAAALLDFGSFDAIDLKGLNTERRPVFAGGVAVLHALFRHLGLARMQVSDEALREGLLYEMAGLSQQEDVRERTVGALARRFRVDWAHAHRVETTAAALYGQVVTPWALGDPRYLPMLCWAARLHEIGLNLSHSQYHKHGAYLIRNSDLSGFTIREQTVLAALVRGHRRRFPTEVFAALPAEIQECTRRLCVLLRLAVLVHRGHSVSSKPMPLMVVAGDAIQLSFPDDWLDGHPLTRAELEQEATLLRSSGFELSLR